MYFDDKALKEFLLPLRSLQRDADRSRRDADSRSWLALVGALDLEIRVSNAVYGLPDNRTRLELLRNVRDEVQPVGWSARPRIDC